MSKIKAAFFDRDGTIIKDMHYLATLNDVQIIDQAVALCKMCQDKGYTLFMVTNQSGVARGHFDEYFVQKTNDFITRLFAEHGVHFEKCYYCPHHPAAVVDHYKIDCTCRKPKPGMLLTAAQEYNIDLSASLMFGDKQADLDAGCAAGCKTFDINRLFTVSLTECTALL